jgi:DNA repair exonuclease SbcCD nuclease subunit
LKNRGVYEDDNINWCVYSLMDHNIPPDIQKSNKKNIGLFHGPIQGLYTDIGYKFEDGFDVSKFKGCDLVLCGDIHKRQVFDIPGKKKAYMIGSTIQQNFGETIRKHGYGVYDVETDQYDFIDLPNNKPFLKFQISSIEDLVDGTEKLLNF